MTKEEAIVAMSRGERVTHRHFDDKEWMTMQLGKIVLEDGVRCSEYEFWQWRMDDSWNDGYSIWKA